MRKVINGKIYDDHTATWLCDAGNGYGIRDFRYVRAGLYVTKKGNFFLSGEGGPMSIFAVNDGDGTSGSEGIVPIDKAEARRLCEIDDVDVETMKKYFDIEEA